MSNVLFDQKISQTLELSYYKPFVRSVLANGTREEVNLLYDQGIVCRPNVIAFHLITGDAWLTVQQSNQLSYDSNAARALVYPGRYRQKVGYIYAQTIMAIHST